MTEALELHTGVSDGDLARAAADGDRPAFAEIYDRYADRLYDFCVGLIGDRDAAADCVQDAFCAAATGLTGLREPDKLRPWLYSIARHHAMRRLRHRYREEVSDELPDMVSHDASPETLAGQSELARLVADAAGGLSDRDRELLDLSYRHGLDGPDLAEALGVTLTSANTMMFRLRQTVERCLGALLVARNAQADPNACPELAVILKGWDGQFSVLMRKRMARHIDSCATCEQEQSRHVNPVALLGGSAVFIPAPVWLRHQTLDRVQLTSASSALAEASGHAAESSGTSGASPQIGKRVAIVGIALLCLSLVISWFARPEDPASKVVDVGTDSSEGPLPVIPRAVNAPPAVGRSQSVPVAGTVLPAVPTQQAAPTRSGAIPGSAPVHVLPNTDPDVAPPPAPIGSVMVPESDPNGAAPDPQVDTAPVVTAPTRIVDAPATPGGPINLDPLPGPGPKIVSPSPGTFTGTVSSPTDKIPTNTNTNTSTNTSTNTNTNTNTSGGGKTTTGGTTTGGAGSTNGSSGTTSGGQTTGGTTNGSGGTTSGSGGTNTKNSTSTSK
ncbi:MAG: sigma-70 family RNA polymerase sigma factor [Mycobacterium sp.]